MMKTSIVVLIVVCLAVLASVGGRDTVEAQTTAPTIGVSTTTTIGSVDVNETFTLRFRMRRLAGDAGHGGITVSIPALDQRDTRSCRSSYDGPKGSVVTASYTNGASNVCYYARGYQPINKADGSTDVADYLLVESDDTDWPVNGYRTLELDVTPKREGTLTIYYRYWLCGSGYQDCTRFPTIGRVDQQGWNVGIITVPVRNQRPSVARVTPSSKRVRLRPGDTQTFEARATDRNDNISQVEWFVDDRSVSGESLVLTGSINKSFTYRFSNPGTYEVVAEFTDLEGDSDDVDWDVEVTDEINVTVGSNPSGRTISVDGTDRTAPYNTTWDSGTSHTLDVASPQRISGVGDRYVFSRWGHGGSQRQTVRPTSNATYTAYFNLQHFLSTRTEPRGVGIPGGGVWYDHGSTARVGPAPTLEGYRFSHWEKNGQNVGSNAAGVSVRVDTAFLVEAVYTAAVANRPPSVFVVSPLGSPELEPGDSQTFTARATDPDNNITQVEWFVNDRSEGGQSLAPTGLISRSFTYVFSNAGMYRVRATFTDTVGGTDSETWMVKVIPPTLNCFRDLGTLPLGRTSISGSWTGDCASTHQSGSYARFYAFTLTRRTQVQIDLRSAADAYLYLMRGSDSAGLIVDEDNDGGSTGNNSLLDLTLETGTYTVEATTLRSGATGNFSLDIDVDATPPAPPLLCIQTLSGVSPTEPGVSPIEGEWASDCLSEQRTGSYARYYTFTLPATPPGSSTKVTVNLESVVDTYLYLLAGEGSDGRVIASNNNGLNRNTHSQISEFLPGGAYTVEATTNQPAVAGEFFLTVSSITVTVPPPRIDDMRCAPLDALVGEVVDCRPTLSGGEPTRYLWGAIGGNPWSGMGEHFATRWDTPGEKRIVFEVCNDTGCDTGEQSITVDAIAPPPLPSVPLGDPTGLQASAAGPGQVRLTWSPGANADVQWLWSVKADGTGGKYFEASGITSIVTVAGLENGQNYWFTIIAGRNVNGIQEWSQWSQWVNSRVSGAVVQAADDDRAALLALYNATGGSNWANRTSWLSNSPIGQWHGVTTNDAGRVTGLNLQDNNVAGRISPALGMLTELQDLNFQGNELTGSIPTELGNLSNLTHLDLGFNELSGEIPRELGDLSNLTRLYLFGNRLSGEIPPELGDLSNLTRLILDDNQLTGPIPPELGNLSNLTLLYLFGNRLSGEIPPELGDLSNLTRLILDDNQLTGPIPPELGNLSNLTLLILDDNQLTGPIPPELGNLSNLTRLYLFGNRLSGEIPPELGDLSNLTLLILDDNQLTGPIPPELGNLSNLTHLILDDNQLTGPIPSELGNLDNLVWLYLAGNQLRGCVPARLQDVQDNDFDDLGRPFCGTAGGAPPASQQAPDLGVTLTISGGGLLYSGATATVIATVFNEGDGAAPGYTLLYYRSQDRRFTNDNVTNSVSAGALPPSTNRISDLGFTVPADAGDYYFAACVGGVPGESDTTDNCSDWASASVLHPVTLTASDCRTESTLNTLGAVPDSTEISGTVLARRAVSQANVIWRVIDAFGNTDSSGIEQLGSMTAGETKDFSISTAWGGVNHTCDPELRWVY